MGQLDSNVQSPAGGCQIGYMDRTRYHHLNVLTLRPTSAWSVSEYVFGVRTSKLTRHLGVKYLSTYSKEYVKQTRHEGCSLPGVRLVTWTILAVIQFNRVLQNNVKTCQPYP
jgi:hypothetical protein